MTKYLLRYVSCKALDDISYRSHLPGVSKKAGSIHIGLGERDIPVIRSRESILPIIPGFSY
ncbi:hypothetical protein K449DRAFT_262665 [Hypoxylon sp. EC38]|nr:hypothetical protein K449DRAFT_262665 [Hypoxylon sp. EC38]